MSNKLKSLKFAPHLVPMVLSGEKYSTWRLWDDKNIEVGDELKLLGWPDLEEFGEAKVVKIIVKPLGQLTEEDRLGHEGFASDEQMYETYTNYYGRPVDPLTTVKIIWFELLK